MNLRLLEGNGLSSKETILYETLLKEGEKTPGELSKLLDIKRTTVYKCLGLLKEKGLVEISTSSTQLAYSPAVPTKLYEYFKRKAVEQEQVQNTLHSMLPDLMQNYIMAVEKPIITTFTGIEGLKSIYDDMLKEGKPIYAALTTAEIEPELFEWLNNNFATRRKKQGIFAKVIASSGDWVTEYKNRDEENLRETIIVPGEQFPFKHEVDIYGDKVAFINYHRGELLIGVIINHPLIAQTMKAWFDLAWVGAETLG
jgi:sugar-specific transcriptional regulator TrmB